jgi:hypothetical protein
MRPGVLPDPEETRMAKHGVVTALAVGSLIGAAPASGVGQLTGTYLAKLSCKGIAAGATGGERTEDEFYIVDLGGGDVQFETGAYGPAFAFVVTELAKPDKGVLSGMTCTKNASNLDGLVARLDVKAKEGSDDASLKGTLWIFDSPQNASVVCKLKAKRTSTTPPKIDLCT